MKNTKHKPTKTELELAKIRVQLDTLETKIVEMRKDHRAYKDQILEELQRLQSNIDIKPDPDDDEDDEENGHSTTLVEDCLETTDTDHNRIVIAARRKPYTGKGKLTRQYDEDFPPILYLRGLVRSDWTKNEAFVWTAEPEEAIYNEEQESEPYQILEHIKDRIDLLPSRRYEEFNYGLNLDKYEIPELCRIICPRGDMPWEFYGVIGPKGTVKGSQKARKRP